MAMTIKRQVIFSHIRIILVIAGSIIAALFIYRFLLIDIHGTEAGKYTDAVPSKRYIFFLSFAVFFVLFSIVNSIFDRRMLKRITQNTDPQKISDELNFGDLRINHASYQAFVGNNEITLTLKEFELLFFLASNNGIVFNKEQIYDKLWGEDMYGDIGTVAVHIKRLREKIEKNPSEPAHIQTVWGKGYKFIP